MSPGAVAGILLGGPIGGTILILLALYTCRRNGWCCYKEYQNPRLHVARWGYLNNPSASSVSVSVLDQLNNAAAASVSKSEQSERSHEVSVTPNSLRINYLAWPQTEMETV